MIQTKNYPTKSNSFFKSISNKIKKAFTLLPISDDELENEEEENKSLINYQKIEKLSDLWRQGDNLILENQIEKCQILSEGFGDLYLYNESTKKFELKEKSVKIYILQPPINIHRLMDTELNQPFVLIQHETTYETLFLSVVNHRLESQFFEDNQCWSWRCQTEEISTTWNFNFMKGFQEFNFAFYQLMSDQYFPIEKIEQDERYSLDEQEYQENQERQEYQREGNPQFQNNFDVVEYENESKFNHPYQTQTNGSDSTNQKNKNFEIQTQKLLRRLKKGITREEYNEYAMILKKSLEIGDRKRKSERNVDQFRNSQEIQILEKQEFSNKKVKKQLKKHSPIRNSQKRKGCLVGSIQADPFSNRLLFSKSVSSNDNDNNNNKNGNGIQKKASNSKSEKKNTYLSDELIQKLNTLKDDSHDFLLLNSVKKSEPKKAMQKTQQQSKRIKESSQRSLKNKMNKLEKEEKIEKINHKKKNNENMKNKKKKKNKNKKYKKKNSFYLEKKNPFFKPTNNPSNFFTKKSTKKNPILNSKTQNNNGVKLLKQNQKQSPKVISNPNLDGDYYKPQKKIEHIKYNNQPNANNKIQKHLNFTKLLESQPNPYTIKKKMKKKMVSKEGQLQKRKILKPFPEFPFYSNDK
ncbi:hypothetical protein M0812_12979 [Anaeramoeba flamelloides]|uniref:Uncharacterized protein n=1 Tax=Anaeramoeba flamelloides TaxID=1746091 RepID=A0AAV7ZG19_9EUKA|nr:hypothetical protein M0812_12979 [Anaeramoeba flamelloides]